MALSDKDRKQLTGFVGVLGLLAAGAFWQLWHTPRSAEMDAMQVRLDSLTRQVEAARRDLAEGSVESLRRRVEEYQRAVQVMRRLVPAASDVPNLIDDVSSRAKLRGVNVTQITPLGLADGSPFKTDRYRFSVVGYYDQVGEFLSDVGSLPRIMVPSEVNLSAATPDQTRMFGDTTGALLDVQFNLRTFVKPQSNGANGEVSQ
jgi:Tfp pilus assembly protein PilO